MLDGASPPAYTPLVELETPVPPPGPLATVKSPKSEALPVDPIVIYWITLVFDGVAPPAIIPRTGDWHVPTLLIAAVKFPKSTALPVLCISIYSIVYFASVFVI